MNTFPHAYIFSSCIAKKNFNLQKWSTLCGPLVVHGRYLGVKQVKPQISLSPLSVTWWTMPSSLTAVPGSHGPSVSGSVIVAISFSPSAVDGGGLAAGERGEADPAPPLPPPLPPSPFT